MLMQAVVSNALGAVFKFKDDMNEQAEAPGASYSQTEFSQAPVSGLEGVHDPVGELPVTAV